MAKPAQGVGEELETSFRSNWTVDRVSGPDDSGGLSGGGGGEGQAGGWAGVQRIWFPLKAWELRVELAGQGDPALLSSPAKPGRSEALVQGCGAGTWL